MKRPREADADIPDAHGLTVLHRVRASSRLVPWHVAAVTCIAACPDGSVFAAGYDDGKVEVFDGALFNCLARIPGSDGSEVSSVAWARAPGDTHWRLFASTLDGALLELSCKQLQPLAATDSFGGAIWCMRPAPSSSAAAAPGSVTQLAAACGDGSVKLYAVHAHAAGAEYERSLPRVEGNVLALAWHPDGRSLVSGGSDGCIHSWDVQRGTELQRITVGTSSAAPPCVWCLAVLRDGSIVSGDGDGAVQFWDGGLGTLLSRHQQAAADVLALAASPDGSSVWASGVDPRVALFQLVPDKATGVPHWVYLDRKQPHSHDVRSLTTLLRPDSDPLLLSGGNDGQLVLYSQQRFLKEHPTRQSRSPQRPLLQLAAGTRPARLLHVQQRTLSVWQLGRAVRSQALHGDEAGSSQGSATHFEGDHWDLTAPPGQLASITTSSSHHIIAAALAPDGSAVAAADRGRLRLFKLVAAAAAAGADPDAGAAGAGALAVQKVRVQARLDAPAVCCAFSSNGQLLFAATGSGHVLAVDADSGEVAASVQLALSGGNSSSSSSGKVRAGAAGFQQQQQQQQQVWCASTAAYMPAVSMMAVAPSGHILALATAGGVELLSLPQLQPRGRVTLVGEPAPITALEFSCNSKFIAVGTAGNAVTAYSSETGMPTQWTLKNHAALAELLQQLPGSIQGLSFRPTPAEPLSLLVHSAGGLCHVDMAAGLALPKPDVKQPRKRLNPALPQAEPCSELGRNGRLLKLQHSCLLLAHTSASEALLLEKPWAEQLQTLLPPLYRHRYGS